MAANLPLWGADANLGHCAILAVADHLSEPWASATPASAGDICRIDELKLWTDVPEHVKASLCGLRKYLYA